MILAVSRTTGGSTGRVDSHRIRKAPLAVDGTDTRSTLHDARRPPGWGALSSLRCHGSVCENIHFIGFLLTLYKQSMRYIYTID